MSATGGNGWDAGQVATIVEAVEEVFGPTSLHEDEFQEVFMAVWRSGTHFKCVDEGNFKESLKRFVCGVRRNIHLQQERKEHRLSRFLGRLERFVQDRSPSFSDLLEMREEVEAIFATATTLRLCSDADLQVGEELVTGRTSVQEVATRLGISRTTVRGKKRRFLLALIQAAFIREAGYNVRPLTRPIDSVERCRADFDESMSIQRMIDDGCPHTFDP